MDIYDAWNASLEDIKRKVTGVSVWTALNSAIPIVLEDDVFVLGFLPKDLDLLGYLKVPGTIRIMEEELGRRLEKEVRVHLLEGATINDWESYKRRQQEAEKIRKRDVERAMRERQAARSWDDVYEQLSREYAAVANRSLPQQKARLLDALVDIVAQALDGRELDESGERSLGRCVERVAQYCDVPSTLVAKMVLERTER